MFEHVVLENFLKIHFFSCLSVKMQATEISQHCYTYCQVTMLWLRPVGVGMGFLTAITWAKWRTKRTIKCPVGSHTGSWVSTQLATFGWKVFPLSDLAAWLHVCRVNPGQCDSCGVWSSLLFSSHPPSPLSICHRDVSINQSVLRPPVHTLVSWCQHKELSPLNTLKKITSGGHTHVRTER